eukprot:8077170-Heterocapsa_arctica.AAC.1
MFCNGFPTSRIFQADVKPCVCSELLESDSIEHYAECELVRAFITEQLRFTGDLRRENVLMIADMNGCNAAKVAVALDCLLTAIRAKRTSEYAATRVQLMHARLRDLRVRVANVAALVGR